MGIQLNFKSYKGIRLSETHPFAQIVLALEGGLELEANGKGGRLDKGQGAFIAPGIRHSQQARDNNRFLVLDCDWSAIDAPLAEHLAQHIFISISPATRQLIGFAEALQQEETLPFDTLSSQWTQLLMTSLAGSVPYSRLARLATRIEASLDQPWTVQDMAEYACLSPSRLHAVFKTELNMSPQEWLTMARLRKAQYWLTHTNMPVAELSQRAGYSDQSALTRAMRHMTDETPAAYRRRQRELRSKIQEV
ncbi:AraC family transcriptional regulator [Microvirga sp. W0021]|uniref:AraC family transcriptional regulator n=1 Tax=Hohaiivirga grylli TaxID=3133970 RepID=A0ABV0BJD7_9HYPH